MLASSNAPNGLTMLFFLFVAFSQFPLFASARSQMDWNRDFSVKRRGVGSSLVTNSARMAAGVGPLKPRTLFSPSRVRARDPNPSALPPITGTIQVTRASDSTVVGFISKNIGEFGYGVTNVDADKMTVSFNPVSSPFNIAITNGAPSYPDLGFAGFVLDNPVFLISTNPTSPGAEPQNVGNDDQGSRPVSESAVWYYAAGSQSLTVQWIDIYNLSPTTYLQYSEANEVVFLWGDSQSSYFDPSTYLVILTVV